MQWSTCFKTVCPYIISIETPQGSGTGFLFTYNKAKTIVGLATAAHIVDYAHDWRQPVKLTHFTTNKQCFVTYDDRAIYLDRIRDSASIMLLAKNFDTDLPTHTLPLIGSDKILNIGEEVGWLGFPSIAHPNLCFFTGRISAHLDNYDSYLIDGVAINGVSGGPVIYIPRGSSSPKIIGAVTSYMPNRIRGDTLPGLLRVQDVTAFHETIETIKNIDEAREKKTEQVDKEASQASTASND